MGSPPKVTPRRNLRRASIASPGSGRSAAVTGTSMATGLPCRVIVVPPLGHLVEEFGQVGLGLIRANGGQRSPHPPTGLRLVCWQVPSGATGDGQQRPECSVCSLPRATSHMPYRPRRCSSHRRTQKMSAIAANSTVSAFMAGLRGGPPLALKS